MNDTALLQAILTKVSKIEKEQKEFRKETSERLDMIGSQVAYLEDDAPTREEHDDLEKRVSKVEKKLAFS